MLVIKPYCQRYPKALLILKAPTSSVSPGNPQHKIDPKKRPVWPLVGLVGPGNGKAALVRESSRWSQCSVWHSSW